MQETDDVNAKLDLIIKQLADLKRGQELYFEQMEALMNLHAMLDLNAPLPAMRKWAISPDFALILYQELCRYQPKAILELGSGVSTVITAYFLAQNGGGQVIAVDHDAMFADITRQTIAEHGLSEFVTVIHAPLEEIELRDKSWLWYSQQAFEHIEQVDFLTVDGPPQQDNPHGLVRYPALPMLFEKLSEEAIILVDDYHRSDEQEAVNMWLEEFNIVKLCEIDTEKGTAILRRNSHPIT